MAERPSLKPAAVSFPTLTPQGQQLGKPGMALSRPFTLIGSRNRAHLHLVSSTVSRNHACVISTDNGLYVRDLASRTGAIVNGRRVKEADLRDGDTLQIGSFKFKFADPAGPVRFPLTPKATAAVLQVGGHQTPLDTRTVLIGRRVTCDIPLTEASASNTHALIFEVNGHRFIRDLGSRTGTLVNGKPVHHQLLEFGDEIKVGDTTFHYVSAHEEAAVREAEPVESETEIALEEEPIGIGFDEGAKAEASTEALERIPVDEIEAEPIPREASEEPIPVVEPERIPVEAAIPDEAPIPFAAASPAVPPVAVVPAVPQGPISVVTASDADVIPFEPAEEVETAREPEPVTSEKGVTANEADIAAADLESGEGFNLHLESEPEAIDLSEPIALDEPQHVERPEAPAENGAGLGAGATADHEPVPFEPDVTLPPVHVEPEPEVVVEASNAPVEVESVTEPTAGAGHFFTASGAAVEVPEGKGRTESAARELGVEESGAVREAPVPQPVETSEPVSAEDDAGPSPVALEELAQQIVESQEAGAHGGEAIESTGPGESAGSATVDLSSMHFEPEASTDQAGAEVSEAAVEAVEEPKPLLDLPPEPVAEEGGAQSTLTADTTDVNAEPPVAELASPTLEPAAPVKKRRGRPPKNPAGAPAKRGRKKADAGAAEVVAPVPTPPVVVPIPVPPVVAPVPTPAGRRRNSRRKRPAEPDVVTPPADEAPVEPEVNGNVTPVVGEAGGQVGASVDDAAPVTVEPAAEVTAEAAAEVVVEEKGASGGEIAAPVVGEEAISVGGQTGEEASHVLTADASAVEPVVGENAPVEESVGGGESDSAAVTTSERETVAGYDVPTPADIAHAAAETDDRLEELAIPLAEPAVESVGQLEPEAVDVVETPAVSSSVGEAGGVGESRLTAHEASLAEPEAEVAPVEVVEPTQPDPESAQVLEPSLDEIAVDDLAPEVSSPADAGMSDTAFGRVIENYASAESGPLVEESKFAEEARVEETSAPTALEEVPAEPEMSGAQVEELEGPQPELVEPEPGAELKTVSRTEATDEAVAETVAETPKAEAADVLGDDFDLDTLDLPEPDFSIDLGESENEKGVGFTAPLGVTESLEEDRTPGPDTSVSSSTQLPEPGEASETAEAEEPGVDLSHDGTPAENESHSALVQPQFEAKLPDPAVTEAESKAETLEPGAETLEPKSEALDPKSEELDLPEFEPVEIEPIDFGEVEKPVVGAEKPAPAAPPSPAAAAPIAASGPVGPPAPPRPAVDPFFGMSRDLASFIGGAPLVLSSAAPTQTPQHVPAPPPPAPPAPKPTGNVTGPANLEDPVPEIDFTAPVDESLDLFEETPEKLDAMPEGLAPLGDVTGVFSTPEGRHPLDAPARPRTGAPQSPMTPPSVAQPPAARATPFRQVAPPPPPRSAPLRSLTAGPQSVAPPPNFPPVVAAPPFAGLGTPQKPPAPFGAPGAPPIREVDVFSHTAFPPLDPSVFGSPQRPATPPHPRRQPVAPEPVPDAGLSVRKAGATKELAKTPPTVPPAPVATVAPPPPKRRWWKKFRVLLGLMLAAIALVILGVFFYTNRKVLEGSLQMQGVDLRGPGVAGARERANALRGLASSPHVVQLAVSNVRQQNLTPGFLERPEELVTMADKSTFEKGSLSFRLPTRNVAEDKVRLVALLDAVWAESGAGNDAAASHRRQLTADQKQLEDLTGQKAARDAELKVLQAQLAAAGIAVRPAMDPGITISENETEDHQRQRELDEAAALVKARREALADAQAQADKADAGAAQSVERVRQNIADLQMRLDAIKLAQSGQSDEAAKRFDAAVEAFRHKLDAVGHDSDSPLAAYRTRAREAVIDVKAFATRLADRERQDALAVAQLRSQLDDRREAHLTQMWANDISLKELAEERNAQAHRYSAAVDSGISDEAQKIKGVLEDIDRKIEARRNALATGAPLSDELQQSLQAAIDRMESDRLAGEQQMSAKLKALQPPALESASADQQKTVDDLKSALATVTSTRQAYASASSLSASEAQEAARKIEAQISEQQARLDSLRQGSGSANDPVQLARAALAQAQAAEEKAATAYAASHKSLGLLHQYADAREATLKLNDAVTAQDAQVKATEDAVQATPAVLKPDEASVKVLAEEDRRVNLLVTGIGAVVIMFAALMWFSGAPQPAPVGVFPVESLHEQVGHDAAEHDAFADDEHPIVA